MRVARSTDAHTDTDHYKTLQQHHQSCRRCRSIWPQFVADTTRVDTPRAPAAVPQRGRPHRGPAGQRARGRPRRTSIHNCRRLIDWLSSGVCSSCRSPLSDTNGQSIHSRAVHTQGDLAVIRLILYNCRRAVLNAVIFAARCRDRSTKVILRLSKTTSYCHSDRPQRTLETQSAKAMQ